MMRKLTLLFLMLLLLTCLVLAKEASAITSKDISTIISNYPFSYFTNANPGIKNSFIKILNTIASNINLYEIENDQLFKSELDQEISKSIQDLISNVNYWLVDCQAQDEIYFKLNELLTSY